MIFVDTGAWYAAFIRDDPDFGRARPWLESNRERLVTTDYVFDELMTLLKARGKREHVTMIGETILSGHAARHERVSASDLEEAWRMFRDYSDKEWSFTDCTSRAVMQRLGITTAFAFDRHFQQFGNIRVVP